MTFDSTWFNIIRVRQGKLTQTKLTYKVENKMTNLELNYLNLGNMNFATLNLPACDETINEFWEKLNPTDQDVELQWVELEISTKAKYNDLSLSQLKELAEVDDLETFDMVLYACDNMFDQALEKYNDGMYTIYNDCKNDADLGWEIATNTGVIDPQADDTVSRYFDFERFGQDCRFNGSIHEYDYDTMVEIHY